MHSCTLGPISCNPNVQTISYQSDMLDHSPEGLMSIPQFSANTLPHSEWKSLYQRAILESDDASIPERIAAARHAMHDRAEEILTDSSSSERQALNGALRNLDLLLKVTAKVA
jgi:hypothetical protein